MLNFDRMLNGSQGMQYARMAEQLGLPSNLAEMAGAQIDAARGDMAGMQRLLQAATSGLSMGQADAVFGRGLPPSGFVPRPMSFLGAGIGAALGSIGGPIGAGIGAGIGAALMDRPFPFGHGFNPFGGVSREAPFGRGMVGRSIERAIKADPFFKAQIERQLGGTIIPDMRNDGKLTIWRPPFGNVGGILRNAIGDGLLPKVGIAAALGGLAIPMAGAMAANTVGRAILGGMQRLEGNITAFMGGSNVEQAKAQLQMDPQASAHAESMGININNASFEDIIFLLLMKYTSKKEKEIMNKIKELSQDKKDNAGGGIGGFFKNLVGGALPIVGGLVGGPLGGALGGLLGGAVQGAGQGGGGQGFDMTNPNQDPKDMSETAKQQALQKLMGDLQKLYEMLSNMIKSMHDMQMTPVRNLRG